MWFQVGLSVMGLVAAGCVAPQPTSSPPDTMSQPPGSQPPGSQPPGSQPPRSESPGSEPPGNQAAVPGIPVATTTRYPIVPEPSLLTPAEGAFQLNQGVAVVIATDAGADVEAVALRLTQQLQRATGFALTPRRSEAAALPSGGVISFAVDAAIQGDETYRLDVTPERITIAARGAQGLYYAVQTLRQLLPTAIEVAGPSLDVVWSVPAVHIEDEPRFSYRGMHLDVGRHFYPVAFIKKYIDLMALYKMNKFHWHLTEDQGWRIEIKKYPRLTEVGGFRKETLIGHARRTPAGSMTGSATEGSTLRTRQGKSCAMLQSASSRSSPRSNCPVTQRAALAAYPELGCTAGPFEVATNWGIIKDIYCPSEKTFSFLEDVLTEVMEIFPSRYIHIGGDEAPKDRWKESAVAQEVIKREGLKDEDELQSYFIRRIEKFLVANKRQLIGWDEILEGGLAPEATVMSWRGVSGGIAAAKQRHDVIMTPQMYAYFDYYQADPATEGLAIGGLLPTEKVYEFEPVPPELSGAEAKHILGAQANVWTEYMKTSERVEYQVFPRLLALAEVVWSPKASRDWGRFAPRLASNIDRLERLGVNVARSSLQGEAELRSHRRGKGDGDSQRIRSGGHTLYIGRKRCDGLIIGLLCPDRPGRDECG